MGGGVASLIGLWVRVAAGCAGWLLWEGGLPLEDGVCGLGTATRSGPVTVRFVATSGGECASDRLSESRDVSETRDDVPSDSGCCGCGWCSSVSCG